MNSGQAYVYDATVPADTPPGLHWYHQHVHGLSELGLLGGASGPLVVAGVEAAAPVLAGLPERVMVFRDNFASNYSANPPSYPTVPTWDVSLNHIPIPYPSYPTVGVPMRPGAVEAWRMVNAGADTLMNISILYDGVPQPLLASCNSSAVLGK